MGQRSDFILCHNQYHSCVMIMTSIRIITFEIYRQVLRPNCELRSCSIFCRPARAGLGYFFSTRHISMLRRNLHVPGFCCRFIGMTNPRYPFCSRYKCPCPIIMLQVVLQPTLPIEPAAHPLELSHKSQVEGCLTSFLARKVLLMGSPSSGCGDS